MTEPQIKNQVTHTEKNNWIILPLLCLKILPTWIIILAKAQMDQSQQLPQLLEAPVLLQSPAKTPQENQPVNSQEASKKRSTSGEDKNPAKKKKRRTVYTLPTAEERIFKVIFNNKQIKQEDQVKHLLHDFNENPLQMVMSVLENGQVKIGPTAAEIKQQRSEYRKDYRTRPETLEKNLKKANDPLEIEKRKLYAARQDVKEKKARAAKEGRRVKALLKKQDPERFFQLLEEARRLEQMENHSTSSTEEDSSDDDATTVEE